MTLPGIVRLELPILQELVATGGVDDVRFMYERLIDYFPQLKGEGREALSNGGTRQWKRQVQRAGWTLAQKRQLERQRGVWRITANGRQRVNDEAPSFSLVNEAADQGPFAVEMSHGDIQRMLLEIGRALGYYAEKEFEYYDVVWRTNESSPRLSHIFEVQRKGNVDAALAKLKRAYEAQRSKPFLIVASERDTNRAHVQLSQSHTGAFHEIGRVTTILSFEQLAKLHRALIPVEDLLHTFFD
ncbi:MAG: winged helix-turn-helix domain-containing protein [Acidobacteriota bacterium]|nr:winged helix-turn-helix domain-containing protein [Acidobacteriota bacterium]